MIYRQPPPEAPVDQGDVIDGCPLLATLDFDLASPEAIMVDHTIARVVVLTQACDLANRKVSHIVVAVVLDADSLVSSGKVKAGDVRGPMRLSLHDPNP